MAERKQIKIDEIIKSERIKLGVSQSKLGEILGTTQTSIYRWETNQDIPHLYSMIALAELFDITLDELVFGDCDKNRIIQLMYESAVEIDCPTPEQTLDYLITHGIKITQ